MDMDIWISIQIIHILSNYITGEHIDPDESEVDEELLERPKKPKVSDIQPNATTYTQLSDPQQRTYDNSRKYYEEDLKQYQRQKDLFRAVRNHIMSSISPQKKLLLDPAKSTYRWLLTLKEDTKPSDHFMRTKIEQQYTEALKGLKLAKFTQWIDRWEHAMTMAQKYELPQMSNGIWLQEIGRAHV